MALSIASKHRRHLIVLFAALALLALAVFHTPARKPPASGATVVASAEPVEHVRRVAPQPVAAPAAQTAPSEGRRADVLAAKSIQEIASAIRDHIASSARFAELAKCDSGVSLPCRDLLSQAIYEAMDIKVLPEAARGGLGVRDLTKHDDEAIFDTVGRLLVESGDSVERASALLLLRSIPSMPLRALPEAAYRNLSERTVAEAQLTLQQPIGGPMPYPEAARELVSLFTHDRDSRLQDAALTALAHPETETELLAAVRETARHHEPDWPDWVSSVGAAVGPCGMACLQAIDAVLDASDDSPAVAEEILRSSPETERLALTDHLKSRFEPKALVALATSAGVELRASP